MTHTSLFRSLLLCLAICLSLLIYTPERLQAQGGTYYVATTGSDDTGDGSSANPWATITYAVNNVPDGSTILVRPGDYVGRVRLDASFAQGVVVRAETPYRARLRNTGTVVTVFEGQGITLEGFDIAHSGPGAEALVIQIQDLRGAEAGGDDYVSRITLRNNILHDSYNNDILKINNGAGQITVEGNIFYNQAGSDEHMDINSVTDVVVQDNIFMNNFAGSGRSNDNSTSSYVVVKDSNGTDDTNLGSQRITLRRNIFVNWEGSLGYGFVQVGEDATANFEAFDVLIENNLMLGNSANALRASVGIMGSRDVTVRNNTVVGDLPGNAFALRLYMVGDNQPNQNIRLFNNIWADPTGTMNDFSDSPLGETASFTLDHNLYWNDGAGIPQDANDMVNITNDANEVLGDPQLPNPASVTLPHWNQNTNLFGDGSATIREAFLRLVASYGTPGSSSAALDAADPVNAPTDDIRGMPRQGTPDLGAYEATTALACPDFVLPAGIDAGDIAAIAALWNQPTTHPDWNDNFDRDSDRDVDIIDIEMVALLWGTSCKG